MSKGGTEKKMRDRSEGHLHPPRAHTIRRSVSDFPGFSRDFDCFDSILEWDGISGMKVVFDSLIFLAVLIV